MGVITYVATGNPMASLGVGGAALMYMTKYGHGLPRVQDDPRRLQSAASRRAPQHPRGPRPLLVRSNELAQAARARAGPLTL